MGQIINFEGILDYIQMTGKNEKEIEQKAFVKSGLIKEWRKCKSQYKIDKKIQNKTDKKIQY